MQQSASLSRRDKLLADGWTCALIISLCTSGPSAVSLSDQGLVQVLEAAVTGLEPGKRYVLALASEPTGGGALQPLQGFMTNPAGAAVVNTIGPIRQLVRGEEKVQRRYLVIAPGTVGSLGAPVQVQAE